MKRLPNDKTHGIIHSIVKNPAHLDKVAEALGLKDKDRERLQKGEIHIVREADEKEIRKGE